ncbi:MAG TPA: cellulose synthase family protein, partial [Anaerolineales bacterium]|nr:cellulose synthase family protein [Anaerolineales bacterium]
VAILYLAIIGLLFLFGIYHFYIVYLAIRFDRQPVESLEISDWPAVTVQLPIYNELYVAERLIRAAARLDYPRDRLEIQVLDDSDDETRAAAESTANELAADGFQVRYIHRDVRSGYKAGALSQGLKVATGEFLAIFDADFIPPVDFLRRTLPRFTGPEIAFVQARWGHLNRDYSLLTFMQALTLDSHFVIEQYARSQAGYWFNFNGTAGIWRREAIEDAGGWRSETLTEDLDLSYRAFLRGWQAKYLRDVVVPAELPVTFGAYRRQHNRWARGGFECARNLVPAIWRTETSLSQKIHATVHLTRNCVYLLLLALALVYPLALGISLEYPGLIGLFGLGLLFNLTAFAPTTYFLLAQKKIGTFSIRNLPKIMFTSVLGAGLMIATTWAAIQAFFGKNPVFDRTPKFGIQSKKDGWVRKSYQLKLDRIVVVEIGFAAFLVAVAASAIRLGNLVITLYSLYFALGLSLNAFMTIDNYVSARRGARKH